MDLAMEAFPNSKNKGAAQLKWSKIETGKQDATIEEIFSIAKVLGVSFTEIIKIVGISDSDNSNSNNTVVPCLPRNRAAHELLEEILTKGGEDAVSVIQVALRGASDTMKLSDQIEKLSKAVEKLAESQGALQKGKKPRSAPGMP